VLAFDLDGGLAAAGYITLAWTLTRYADRADHVIATTIYPAIVAVRDRLPTLEEIFEKSNRVALMWVLPFCAGFVLFAPDLVEFVLGDEWEPAVVLLQGLAGAAGLQQLGYNWFSFYRARGDSRPQAVESAALVAGFLGFAMPGLVLWGFDGFVLGRIAGVLLVLAVRVVYVRRLLPGVRVARLALRGAAPVLGAGALVLLVRLALWGDRSAAQAGGELALFLAAAVALTWLSERDLLRELLAKVRAPGRGRMVEALGARGR
jgi:O-antigen/teichoic acid export membrane protein